MILRNRAAAVTQVDERVGYPPLRTDVAHYAVGHGDHPLDKAVRATDEFAVRRRNHVASIEWSVQSNAVVLPEVGVARAAEHGPMRERPHLLAHSLLPRQIPAAKPLLTQ